MYDKLGEYVNQIFQNQDSQIVSSTQPILSDHQQAGSSNLEISDPPEAIDLISNNNRQVPNDLQVAPSSIATSSNPSVIATAANSMTGAITSDVGSFIYLVKWNIDLNNFLTGSSNSTGSDNILSMVKVGYAIITKTTKELWADNKRTYLIRRLAFQFFNTFF
jgi:hypothetical protein